FPHALTAAKYDLVAGAAAQVPLDFDEQLGVTEADPITSRRTEQTHVLVPGDARHARTSLCSESEAAVQRRRVACWAAWDRKPSCSASSPARALATAARPSAVAPSTRLLNP